VLYVAKAGHIIEFDTEQLRLLDLSFACSTHATEACVRLGHRRATAYVAPEIAKAIFHSTNTTQIRHSDDNVHTETTTSLQATVAMDMWSLGAIFYLMCTGCELFLSDCDHCIDQEQLRLLSQWPLYAKTQRLRRIQDPLARNLIEQLLSLEERLRPTTQECLEHPFLREILGDDVTQAGSTEILQDMGDKTSQSTVNSTIISSQVSLSQSFDNDEFSQQISSSTNKLLLPFRYVGMTAQFDLYLAFRRTSIINVDGEDPVDRLQRKRLDKARELPREKVLTKLEGEVHLVVDPVDDAVHCQKLTEQVRFQSSWRLVDSNCSIDASATSNIVKSNEQDQQLDIIARTLSQSRTFVVLLSRFAVNSEALCLTTLTRLSPLHLFLFEIRVAFELLSRGLIEGGIFVVAIGDCLHIPKEDHEQKQSMNENFLPTHELTGHPTCTDAALFEYGPFFQHFQQEITLSSGNCFPAQIPDVSIDALEVATQHCLTRHGLGGVHFQHMTVRDMFRRLLRMPAIHVRGRADHAFQLASDDLVIALQRKLGHFASTPAKASSHGAARSNSPLRTSNNMGEDFNGILSLSRPHTSAFQKMIESRIPSPHFNRSHLTQSFSDSRGGLLSRGGLRSSQGIVIGQSFSAKLSPLAQGHPMLEDGTPNNEQDVKYFNDDQHGVLHNQRDSRTPVFTNFMQQHEQHPPKQVLPYFTDIVSLDKNASENLMHYLVEKMEVRDTEVNNLLLEMALMEERMQWQQQELHRMRRLVRVTDTLDMDGDRNEDMFQM
jgi:serine/threonine protein kinase